MAVDVAAPCLSETEVWMNFVRQPSADTAPPSGVEGGTLCKQRLGSEALQGQVGDGANSLDLGLFGSLEV